MPARSTFAGDILVVSLRCQVTARAVPEVVLEQMRLAHWLRNNLVAVERRHAEAVAEVWTRHPQVAAATADVEAASAVVEALVAQAREERMLDRGTEPRTSTRAEIKEARSKLRAARAHLKETKASSYAVMREELAEAQAARRLDIKQASAEAKGNGLLWHTHDAVLADHDTAVAKVIADRRAGKPAELRFKRWTGEGRLRVTLMRSEFRHGCGKRPPWPCGELPVDCPDRRDNQPARTAALLVSGQGPWRNVAQLPPHLDPAVSAEHPPRGQGEREIIRLRVGAEPDGEPIWWDLPVFVDHPLPEEAEVVFIEVTRRKVAGNWRSRVSLTCRIPATPARTSGDVAAVDLGWRSVDGGIRVGVVASTGKLPPPPDWLAGVVRPLDDHHAEIIAPDDWRDVLAHTMELQGVRSMSLDVLRRKIVDALQAGVEGLEVTAAEVARWRSPARFAVLARAWPADHELAPILEAWRRQDKHLWEGEAHERDQIVARRLDTWRKVGVWLFSGDVAVLVCEEMHIGALSAVPDVEEGDDRQARLARAQRTIAAPGELRMALVKASRKRGVRVEAVDPAKTTRIHSACGTEIQDQSAFAASVMVWCPTCGVAFDQDVSAANNLIGRITGDPEARAES